jgi:REP element-mobilizing transposase RayT
VADGRSAEAVRDQFLETAGHRGWSIHAAAVMTNHFHVVVTADEKVLTDVLLRDLKSYASRALNAHWPRPASGTWWTASGSRRKLADERAVEAAIRYVLNQHAPLALYPAPERGASAPRDTADGSDAGRSSGG